MLVVHVSTAARQDFDQIWLYIATDDPIAADRFLSHIGERCQSYAHQPQLGEARSNLGRHLRCFSVGNYVVYYRPTSDGIEIARVLHGARDIQQL